MTKGREKRQGLIYLLQEIIASPFAISKDCAEKDKKYKTKSYFKKYGEFKQVPFLSSNSLGDNVIDYQSAGYFLDQTLLNSNGPGQARAGCTWRVPRAEVGVV